MAKFSEDYFKEGNSMNRNSIEDVLAEGEQLLWRGKPKKSAYIWASVLKMLPVAIIWLFFDGAFIGLMIGLDAFSHMPTIAVVFICVFMLVHLLPVWIWVTNIVTAGRQHKNIEYAFTNTRIIIRSGLIGIDMKNIYYADVQNVNLKVGLIDKRLHVGDIYITSSNKAQVLWDIERPYEMTSKLQKIIADIKADTFYPNALRPQDNPGYTTKYNGGNISPNGDNEK